MASENVKTVSVKAKDSSVIRALFIEPEKSDKRAVIIISHGFSEHSHSYIEIAQELCWAGFACLIPDQRGHGQPPDGSKKWYGIIPNYQSFIDDIKEVTEKAKELAPNLPIAMYGHSMGGGIVLNTLLRMTKTEQSQYICAIVESPWLNLHKPLGKLTRNLLNMLSRIAPNIRIKQKPKSETLSSDNDRAENITADEHYHGYLSFLMLKEIMDACDYAMDNAAKLHIPTFLALADKDIVVHNDSMREFAKRAGDIVALKEYDSLHAIHNDTKREFFRKDMIDFIDSYMPFRED